MINKITILILSAAVICLVMAGGCATVPTGPSVTVFPAPGKSFEQFQEDDAVCRQWAAQQTGTSPQETLNQNTATGAVAGTVIGGGLGAAIGAAGGHAGTGAAIGAGTGLLFGTLAGSDRGYYYGRSAQRRYDIAYQQCMYAKGNQVPGVIEPAGRTRMTMPPPPPPDYEAPADPDEQSLDEQLPGDQLPYEEQEVPPDFPNQ
ncbi:MAG TPA: YMGG-like glycine zipper-containing protein [Dissulfurispiraceae bacterium]|nr:YMGG-like glycine zipper-containing protein [Dissulfurispiraceae bacterium]